MFLCIPRSRRTLAALCAGVALLTLTGGLERNLEYLSRVVPAQARAEGTEFTGQYSLAALLAHLGVPDALALAAGSASYAFMLIAGSAVAFYAQRKTGDVAFGVAVAPARPRCSVRAGGRSCRRSPRSDCSYRGTSWRRPAC